MADEYRVDLDDLTLGEVEELEEKTGYNFAGNNQSIPVKAITYMLYLQERRKNSKFTLDDARAVKISGIKVGEEENPTTPTPLSMSGSGRSDEDSEHAVAV
jgi:hypothetical protein